MYGLLTLRGMNAGKIKEIIKHFEADTEPMLELPGFELDN